MLNEALNALSPSRNATEFRIPRAFEADALRYGASDPVAAELIFAWYDVLADLVAAGQEDVVWALVELLG